MRAGRLGCGRRRARSPAASRPAARRSRRSPARPHPICSSRAPAAVARATNSVGRLVGGERRHGPDDLAVDAQPFTARGQQPQPWAVAQQVVRDLGGGVDDVLTVVQHDEQLAIADHRRQPARDRSGPARAATAARTAAGSPTAASSTSTAPSSTSAGRPPGGLERQAGLAHAARSDQRQQAVLAGEPADLARPRARGRSAVSAPPGALSRVPAGGRSASDGRRGPSSAGSCARIAASRRRSSGPGSRPSSSREDRPAVPVGAQGVGLPPGAVQRQHQQGTEPLPERMGRHQRLERGDGARPAELHLGIETLLRSPPTASPPTGSVPPTRSRRRRSRPARRLATGPHHRPTGPRRRPDRRLTAAARPWATQLLEAAGRRCPRRGRPARSRRRASRRRRSEPTRPAQLRHQSLQPVAHRRRRRPRPRSPRPARRSAPPAPGSTPAPPAGSAASRR